MSSTNRSTTNPTFPMLSHQDEQEEEYLQKARQLQTPTLLELANDELPRLMMNLSLPYSQMQTDHGESATLQTRQISKRKLTNRYDDEDQEGKRRKTIEDTRMIIEQDYTSLPSEITLLVLDKLLEPVSHARFGLVCKEWLFIAKEYSFRNQVSLRVLPPVLLLLNNDSRTMLYSLSESKLYKNIKLPMPSDDKIYSGFGFIGTLHYPNPNTLEVSLTNPFRKSNKDIRLPPLSLRSEDDDTRLHPDSQVRYGNAKPQVKIILPSDPNLDQTNNVVLAICGYTSRLFLIRGGQKLAMQEWCITAAYAKGRVFSLIGSPRSRASVLFISSRIREDLTCEFNTRVAFFSSECYHIQTYLLTSTEGDLLIVESFLGRGGLHFKVSKWVESLHKRFNINSIGDKAIFLSSNQSVSVLASKFGGYVKPNCIYYTNEAVHEKRPRDIGVYSLKEKNVTQLCGDDQLVEWSKGNAFWITPAFPKC